MSGTVNLRELAARLSLSESTVSKALNDRPDISQAVKDQVRAAARALGYVPNKAARRLALGRSGMLGVFLLNRFGRPAGEYFGFNFLGGLMKEAQERGFDLLVFQESAELESCGYLEYARRRGVEGTILVGLWPNDPKLRLDPFDDLPWISIDTPIPGSSGNLVSTDNRRGIATMLDAVYCRGHRRIGYIGIHGGGYVGIERRAGFESFCAERGILSPDHVRDTALTMQAGYEAAMELLSGTAHPPVGRGMPPASRNGAQYSGRPTALVCATDLQALGALRAARELGLSVPDDLAVTGFDNLPAAALSSPGLTTMQQDTDGIGRAAIRSLVAGTSLGGTDGPGATRTEPTLVSATLVLRESL
jgi:DNA-binding LacI/PurR family transcriptional regulator